jgi:transposase-like protein
VPFVRDSVAPGSVIHTDGWLGYRPLERQGYQHDVTFIRGKKKTPSELMPRVHRVISLLKRWLMGTHQGAVSHKHLDYYLDEYTFRFNRRGSTSRGKLFFRLVQQALVVEPVPLRSQQPLRMRQSLRSPCYLAVPCSPHTRILQQLHNTRTGRIVFQLRFNQLPPRISLDAMRQPWTQNLATPKSHSPDLPVLASPKRGGMKRWPRVDYATARFTFSFLLSKLQRTSTASSTDETCKEDVSPVCSSISSVKLEGLTSFS